MAIPGMRRQRCLMIRRMDDSRNDQELDLPPASDAVSIFARGIWTEDRAGSAHIG
jgi:hypothetical protein